MRDFHEPPDDPEERAAPFMKVAQGAFDYCYNCQPYEGGEPVWILGVQTDLGDVFEALDVPEDAEVREALAASLRCPNCGTDGFDVATEVGTKGHWERDLEARFAVAQSLYGSQIEAFEQFLERTPTLGLAHDFGKILLEKIKAQGLPRCDIGGEFFRARLADASKVFAVDDLDAPPTGKSSPARFSHAGQRVLYLASSEGVAVAEAMGDRESAVVWVQRFTLQTVGPVLDLAIETEGLTDDDVLLIALLNSRVLAKPAGLAGSNWTPGYLLPRFVADCARAAGYVGIKYGSVRSYGDNVVLFDRDAISKKLSSDIRPKLLAHSPPPDPFGE
jgi:hypothetical protein